MSSALVVMDVQVGVVEHYGAPDTLDRIAEALEAARASGIPVAFVRLAFRPGFPEISSNNKIFSELSRASSGAFLFDSPDTQLHPRLGRQPQEPVMIKRRVSALAGSDLDIWLRAQGVSELVVAGISTSGVVLSTVLDAADRDYRLTVLSDACCDPDRELHRMLMDVLFPRQASVVRTAEWIQPTRAGN